MELAEPPALPSFRCQVKSIHGKMHFRNLIKIKKKRTAPKTSPRKAVGLRKLKGEGEKIREV